LSLRSNTSIIKVRVIIENYLLRRAKLNKNIS
jgi:hypothetical protein